MLKRSVREFGPAAINNVLFLEPFPRLRWGCASEPGTSLPAAVIKAVFG